jgi:hypothetical protein
MAVAVGLLSVLGSEGDDGKVVLEAAGVGGNLNVGSEVRVGDGWFWDDPELRIASERGDDAWPPRQ